MSALYQTEQEAFWAGEFGNAYVDRNSNPQSVAFRTAVFSKILNRTRNINRVLEFGANIGQNLLAIKNLIPNCSFTALEINVRAVEILRCIPATTVFHGSILDFTSDDLGTHDLTLTAGVLIHINPDVLPDVYSRLYECSRAYILINE